jgi:hypothetical protein
MDKMIAAPKIRAIGNAARSSGTRDLPRWAEVKLVDLFGEYRPAFESVKHATMLFHSPRFATTNPERDRPDW